MSPYLKEILRFEKKKFGAPIVLLSLFAILMFAFSIIGGLEEKHACAMVGKALEIQGLAQKNLTGKEALATNVAKMAELRKLMQLANNDSLRFISFQPLFMASYSVLGTDIVEPFLPAPCEFYPDKRFCSHYMSEQAYACVKQIAGIQEPTIKALLASFFGNAGSRQHQPLSAAVVMVNMLWLILAGYLASGIVLFASSRIVNKLKETRQRYKQKY